MIGVPFCEDCEEFYFSGSWPKDEEGAYDNCIWCGEGGELLMCSTAVSLYFAAAMFWGLN